MDKLAYQALNVKMCQFKSKFHFFCEQHLDRITSSERVFFKNCMDALSLNPRYIYLITVINYDLCVCVLLNIIVS
jgi:hypothetical protein